MSYRSTPFPSVKTLVKAFERGCRVEPVEAAKSMRKAWIAQTFDEFALITAKCGHVAEPGKTDWARMLHFYDFLAMNHGIEWMSRGKGRRSPRFAYSNTGDSYCPTLVYLPDSDTWRVTTWGDIVERGNYA